MQKGRVWGWPGIQGKGPLKGKAGKGVGGYGKNAKKAPGLGGKETIS